MLRSVKSSAVAAQENIGEDVNYEDVEKMVDDDFSYLPILNEEDE